MTERHRFELELARSTSDIRTTLALIRTIEAEKRTYLAELRTGIGVLTVPMSLVTILVATSRYYDVMVVLPYVIGLAAGVVALVLVGGYLVVRSLSRLRLTERLKETACTTASATLVMDESLTEDE
ncbi:MAG: hypothetical protein ACTSYX_10290 [Candidatus Thorarchaeota archaeon]